METRPPAERFWMARFAVQVTRGLVRDQRARRQTMAILLFAAIAMVVAGVTGLRPWLEPRDHAVRFILFWFACAWVTLTALLLALLDMLLIRAQARHARKLFREEFSKGTAPGAQSSSDENK
jgi:uncharacterized membrane protein YozB (DUF420 family)